MAVLAAPPLLGAGPAQDAVDPAEKIFEPVHAVSPASMPTGMIISPSGKYLYAGEGASIALLDTGLFEWWKNPVKIFTLASRGIVPVAKVFDPQASIEDEPEQYEPGANDLIYVAAGRDGLWVLHADPRANEPNPAFRVDDSPDGDKTDQSGRRWASALDYVTVDGTEFLAVLFAAKDDSYLRLYELQDLRDLANDLNSTETGSEIAPARNISLNQSPEPHIDYWHSYAFGMAVDQDGGVEGGADVYVAHGAHGLVRVRLYPNVSSPFPEIDLEIGPWFGDDSAYADGMIDPPVGFGTTADPGYEVYDDLKYWAGTNLERSHPPIFTDVAYHDGFLYATVESAGWVRFELRDGQGTDQWAQDMKVDHHEGWQHRIVLASGEILLGLIEENEDPQVTWTRRIVVIETSGGFVLAVTSGPEMMSAVGNTVEQRHEGRTHTDPLSNAASAGMGGGPTYTILYRLGCGGFDPGQENHDIAVARGGDHVVVPTAQGVDHCQETEPEEVIFVASSRKNAIQGLGFLEGFEDSADPENSFSTYWVKASWDGTISATETRDRTHRPGWFTRYATVSLLDESILLAGNDAGLPLPGVHWTCGEEFHSGPAPAWPLDQLDAANLHTSVLVNGEAQWLADPLDFPFQAYYWRSLRGEFIGTSWGMVRYSVGRNLCETSPTDPKRLKSLIIDLPNDRFGVPGRRHYLPGAISEVYDAWYQQDQGPSDATLVFGVRSGTDSGIVIMRRDELQAKMDDSGTQDGHEVHPQTEGVIVGTLVTAPELAGVLSPDHPSQPPTHNFVQANDLAGPTTNFSPRFFTLYDGDQNPPERQMLAIPAGQVSVKPDDPFMSPPGFTFDVPAPYDQHYRHWKVCIFDITKTDDLDPFGSPLIPAWTILGPDPGGFAADVQVKQIEGQTMMFVVDHRGELLLYDISDILSELHGGLAAASFPHEARFVVREDLTDQFRSDLYGVVVEEREWDDGGVPRPQLYAYLGASRVGIEVFRFRPAGQDEAGLKWLGIVQVPGEAEGMWIREDPDDEEETQLVVCNTYGGIRILKRRPPLE